MTETWIRACLGHRRPVLLAWLAVFPAGGYATAYVSKLLSKTFTVPRRSSRPGA